MIVKTLTERYVYLQIQILHLSIPTNCFVNAPVPLRLRVDAVIHVRVPLGVEHGYKSAALISAEMMMSTLD